MQRRVLWLTVVPAALTVLWLAGTALAQGTTGPQATEVQISYFDWFVIGGGGIGWLIMVIDVASVALAIEYFISIRRTTLVPDLVRAQVMQMVENKQYRELIEFTASEPSFLSYVVHQALSEAGRGYAAMEEALEDAAEERSNKLLRKIEMLNLAGNVAPMLGLLGTVYGMILAFAVIVARGGSPDPKYLAQSVGIALVTTFWGLVVAIPALAVYTFMRGRIDALSGEVMSVAQEVISTFRPGAAKKPAASAAEPAAGGA